MKFKVGDKVTIISNPEENKDYYMDDGITHSNMFGAMLYFTGMTALIVDIDKNQYILNVLNFNNINFKYYWTDEMFVEGQKEKKPPIAVDDLSK